MDGGGAYSLSQNYSFPFQLEPAFLAIWLPPPPSPLLSSSWLPIPNAQVPWEGQGINNDLEKLARLPGPPPHIQSCLYPLWRTVPNQSYLCLSLILINIVYSDVSVLAGPGVLQSPDRWPLYRPQLVCPRVPQN